MFTVNELMETVQTTQWQGSLRWVKDCLIRIRLNQAVLEHSVPISELAHFVECVLCSAPDWRPSSAEGRSLCISAAEVAELLWRLLKNKKPDVATAHQVRAVLLYELAEKPFISSSISRGWKFSSLLTNFISRRDLFGQLSTDPSRRQSTIPSAPQDPQAYQLLGYSLFEYAWSEDALLLAKYEHGEGDVPVFVTERLEKFAASVSMGIRATDLRAFSTVIRNRLELSTRRNLPDKLFRAAKSIDFPIEMWPQQAQAIADGLLDPKFDSFGLASPTGTGKTFLSRLLILQSLQQSRNAKILYVVPSKALVNEVSNALSKTFEDIGHKVLALRPNLVSLDEEEEARTKKDSVIVLTPEKADLLLRLSESFFNSVTLVIVDEAHHIESGTRGILLEMYLVRLRRLLNSQARITFLSAVAPNIRQLAASFGNKYGGSEVKERSTKMRAGVYRIKKGIKGKQGWIDYSDGTSVEAVDEGVGKNKRIQLVQLADKLSALGPVLVVARGKRECEALGLHMLDWIRKGSSRGRLGSAELSSEYFQRLDACLEREMYEAVAMRELIPFGIAYHHAGLPPRVRRATEEAIKRGLIKFVFATTTLAEGVNFPFSAVIVQSLALKTPPELGVPSRYQPVTPRAFWNIAGRAGRPGQDSEGHAVLFEPSLGLEKVNAVIGDYLDPSFDGVPPVGSALADAIREIKRGIADGDMHWSLLEQRQIESLPRSTQGALNLIRTSIIHAKAGGWESPEDILESTFAQRFFSEEEQAFSRRLSALQREVVDSFFSEPSAPSWRLAAELGLSIDTLSSLRDYVRELPDFRIEDFGKLFYGGWLNFVQVKPLISAVSKRMSELEGNKLGDSHTELVVQWLSGTPFHSIKLSGLKRQRRLEDLISILYSRVQFLLPWGLYATDRLVEEEAKKRGLKYRNEIRHMAYLVDAGVPGFDALQLVKDDMERVDATRLATRFKRFAAESETTEADITDWVLNQPRSLIEKYIKSPDNRRLDHDLDTILWQMRDQ